MGKTRIGIPAAVVAAMLCLLGYYGGYMVTILAAGYVLLAEESEVLKRLAVKVLVFMFAFSLLNTAIYLIPNLVSLFRSLISIFSSSALGDGFYAGWLYRSAEFGASLINMLEMVVFLLMGTFALIGKELKIPVLENLLDKYLFKAEE